MKSFVDKYKPKLSKDIPQKLDIIKDLIKNKNHILIYGPTGSCKTSSLYTIAKELDYEIIEVNASDFRNKDQIESIIGSASKQKSLFQKEKLLIIDEVDCLSGTEDRGGAQAISSLLKESSFPIALTANDHHNDKLKDIRKQVELIEFKPIPSREIINIVKNICISEKIKFTDEALKNIAVNSNGDLRAALNDLQSSIINQELIILNEEREYELGIMHIINNVLKSKSFEANRLLEKSNIDLNEYSLWLDENIPLEYKNENDLFKAYEILSKADIFKGRIRRWQQWRLMYYQSLLLSSGISIVKKNINNNLTNFKRSMRPLRIWQFNMKNAKKKSIAKKISSYTHTSVKEVINNFNNYKFLINSNVQKELKLDEEEINYIKNIN